jgi:polar amino acid transport system substrate-binding protein
MRLSLTRYLAIRVGVVVLAVLALALAGSYTDSGSVHAAGQQVMAPAKGQSPNVDKIQAAGKIRVAVAIALPTIGQDPKTGEYFGVAIEIPKRIASALGVKLELIPAGWDVLIAGLQAKRFDLVAAGLYATPERKKVIDFVTYTDMGFCYAVLKSNQKINKLEEMNDPSVKIGTYTGTGTEQNVRRTYPKATMDTVVSQPGEELRLNDLLAGRIDVAPFDSPLALVVEKEYSQVKIVPGGAASCAKHPDIPTPVGLGLPKGDDAYKSFVQAIVSQMQSGGEIDAILAKYSTPEYLKIAK